MQLSRASLAFAVAIVLMAASVPALAWASAAARPATRASAATPREAGCQIFPASNPLNQEIVHAPVNPNSAKYVASIGLRAHLHADFGATAPTRVSRRWVCAYA